MATTHPTHESYMNAQKNTFDARMRVSSCIEDLGRRMKALGLPSRWSIKRMENMVNSDPATMNNIVAADVSVDLVFKVDDMERFNNDLKELRILQKQHDAIEKLRCESPEFNDMMKVVEFTLEMGS